jgi:hypothetical protein
MSDRSMTKLMLTGMTDKTAEELMPLARSWYNPPEIKGENLKAEYDQSQRAYVLTPDKSMTELEFQIEAGEGSPVINPAFVIPDWGTQNIELEINGDKVSRGKKFRFGTIDKLDGSDLIVWIEFESKESVQIKLTSKK